MPRFYARSKNAQGSYASIKQDGSLVWGTEKHSTPFHSAEEARSAVLAAAELTLAAATAAYLAAAAGGYVEFTDPRSGETRRQAPQFHSYCPRWLYGHMPSRALLPPEAATLDHAAFLASFRVDSQATLEDVLGSFELFYVRCAHGWLGGPRTKASWGSFPLHDSFSKSIGFSSREAAAEALALASDASGHDHAIIKSSCAFTRVERVGLPIDDVASGIGSACEARDIESAIKHAASERLADMRSQAGDGSATGRRSAKARL